MSSDPFDSRIRIEIDLTPTWWQRVNGEQLFKTLCALTDRPDVGVWEIRSSVVCLSAMVHAPDGPFDAAAIREKLRAIVEQSRGPEPVEVAP